MITNYRLRHGLFWRGTRPGLAELRRLIHAILAVAFFLAAIAITEAFAEATDRAIHAERAAEAYGAQAKALKDCEAGAVGYYYEEDGRVYQCGKQL